MIWQPLNSETLFLEFLRLKYIYFEILVSLFLTNRDFRKNNNVEGTELGEATESLFLSKKYNLFSVTSALKIRL